MVTYVVLSGKGGVGKSTVAVNLAVALVLRGKRVGLLDTDLHGPSVPRMLGIEQNKVGGTNEKIEPVALYGGMLKVMSVQFMLQQTSDSVIWRGPLKHNVISQFVNSTDWGALDYLVIDSPPGTGDEPLSVVQTAKPDGAIVVTTPQSVATFDVRKSIDFCRRLNTRVIGVVENMSGFVCPHCGTTTNIFGSGGGEALAHECGVPFLGRVPITPQVVALSDSGRPVTGSSDGAATLMDPIVQAIIEGEREASPAQSIP